MIKENELQPVFIQSDGDYVRCRLGELYLKDEVDEYVAKLKAKYEQLKKEVEFMHSNCKWGGRDACARLLGEKFAIIEDKVKLEQKIKDLEARK